MITTGQKGKDKQKRDDRGQSFRDESDEDGHSKSDCCGCLAFVHRADPDGEENKCKDDGNYAFCYSFGIIRVVYNTLFRTEFGRAGERRGNGRKFGLESHLILMTQ